MSTQLHPPLAHNAFVDSDQRANSDVRLSVEQVSYAYSSNPSQAPLFTLEALSFQAKPGELVGHPWTQRLWQIHVTQTHLRFP